jgi:hypothetical protein
MFIYNKIILEIKNGGFVVLLKDIRQAVQSYLDNRVSCSISTVIPDGPTVLSPKEGFTFSITAKNAGAADPDSARLKNIGYYVGIVETDKAKLIVPPITKGTAYLSNNSIVPLPPLVNGKENEVNSYFLRPPEGDFKVLDVGETDTIEGLRGIAKELGNFTIKFNIHADPDMDWLFPKDENSGIAARSTRIM